MNSLLRCSLFLLCFSLYGIVCVPAPNETDASGRRKTPVDIHSAKDFNLTEWIETYPSEKEELQQWKTHLLEHASTSMTSLKYNVMYYLLTNGVVYYFKKKEAPIHMEEIEWNPVNIDSMNINGGKFRYTFLEAYRDPQYKTFYEGFEAFYEDMESAEVTLEGENKTETYFLWGRNYNITPMLSDYEYKRQEVSFEITKIYVKKWEAVKDVLKAPGDIMLKKYVYKVVSTGIDCYWWCYGGEVTNVMEAHASHFVNTGRTKKKSWTWE